MKRIKTQLVISAGSLFYKNQQNSINLRHKVEEDKKKKQKNSRKEWKNDKGGGWSCDQLPRFFNFLFV